MITKPQALLLAKQLTIKKGTADEDKLTSTLLDAKVEVLPHQVDAALFAFRSPLSNGAILADEVGLGKTIEAALVISQFWASYKRKILIICPANLRKQWSEELQDKFFLDSVILEGRTLKTEAKGKSNPFDQNRIVIVSYNFARDRAFPIKDINWDLVIIDEAHRLRNVYSGNQTATTLKMALHQRKKILLTATPLQNSLNELFGLVSIVDDAVFGDITSFKEQYSEKQMDDSAFENLRNRLKNVSHRTLRQQVTEDVFFTARKAIVQPFSPESLEMELYEKLNQYLRRETLFALPASQRQLITMVFRKLMASSVQAISATLQTLINRLEDELSMRSNPKSLIDELADNFEDLSNTSEEGWSSIEPENSDPLSIERAMLMEELNDLKSFQEKAARILVDAKGERLLDALLLGLSATAEKGGQRKALVFTESRVTQRYVQSILENEGFKTVLFNGTNSDPKSKIILKEWLKIHKNTRRATSSSNANMRAALVDYFKNDAEVMIATEAAAEGINLQFCSLVINYDLPWNPQRIEQRIGRCHRYGQKNEVVVVNFLNQKNAADERVFDLLSKKFHLFEGVFGASDEVLGAVESGVDFEKRIADIFQNCQSADEIQAAFDLLESDIENKERSTEKLKFTREKLLSNFDNEVQQKLRFRKAADLEMLDNFRQRLWRLTRHYLNPYAAFDENDYFFSLNRNPYPDLDLSLGPYRLRQSKNEQEEFYRPGHPLAQKIIQHALNQKVSDSFLIFRPLSSSSPIAAMEGRSGQKGYIRVSLFSNQAFEEEEHLLACGYFEDETHSEIESEMAIRFFDCPARESDITIGESQSEYLKKLTEINAEELGKQLEEKNRGYFKEESDKLDLWAEDQAKTKALEIKDLQKKIRELKASKAKAFDLKDDLDMAEQINNLERELKQKRNRLDQEEEAIFDQKNELILNLRKRLGQEAKCETLFTIAFVIE